MTRPRKCRFVENSPTVDYFKPRGVPMGLLKEVRLSVEGFEALRLSEIMGLDQDEAAVRMKISRHTFGRVLAMARKTVAEAVVLGMALRIEGGAFTVEGAESTYEVPGKMGGICRMEDKTEGLENSMSVIAISSEGPSLDDLVDPRFGRAAGFVIFDTQTKVHSYLDNGSSQARAQGAGIQAAEIVADAEASVVLTGYVGPKAFQALTAVGIKVVQDLGGITVREALRRCAEGGVEFAEGPNR
ncbi:MAG: DUF134 domain-containing protein [Deltaproteobacteria bacterium]|nr:DUF134 domain-containing protein [Deltaproteobacteria bacterium]